VQFVQNGFYEENATQLEERLREILAEEDKASAGGPGEPERSERRS
jgi:hypothetical protein